MALYNELPVFKAAYDLLLDSYRFSATLTRELKYTLGEKLKNETLELLMLVCRANSSKTELDIIQQAREQREVTRLGQLMWIPFFMTIVYILSPSLLCHTQGSTNGSLCLNRLPELHPICYTPNLEKQPWSLIRAVSIGVMYGSTNNLLEKRCHKNNLAEMRRI